MQLTLTKEMLIQKDACEDGVEAFVSMFGESATVEWTRDKQIDAQVAARFGEGDKHE